MSWTLLNQTKLHLPHEGKIMKNAHDRKTHFSAIILKFLFSWLGSFRSRTFIRDHPQKKVAKSLFGLDFAIYNHDLRLIRKKHEHA